MSASSSPASTAPTTASTPTPSIPVLQDLICLLPNPLDITAAFAKHETAFELTDFRGIVVEGLLKHIKNSNKFKMPICNAKQTLFLKWMKEVVLFYSHELLDGKGSYRSTTARTKLMEQCNSRVALDVHKVLRELGFEEASISANFNYINTALLYGIHNQSKQVMQYNREKKDWLKTE